MQGWERGHYTAEFTDAEDLRARITRALHEYTLATQSAPLDHEDLAARARALLPTGHSSGTPTMCVAVAPGPLRAVVRPAQLEAASLHRFLLGQALTGDDAVLTPAAGTDTTVQGDTLALVQRDAHRSVTLDESGRLLVVSPATDNKRGRTGITSLIEEDLGARIGCALRFAARVLDHIDDVGRLTHVAPVVCLLGAGYMPWRTRAQQQESPNAATMGRGSQERVSAVLTPAVRRRPALVHENSTLVDDFLARLRREIRG